MSKEKETLFLRKASGIVKTWDWFSMFAYNVFALSPGIFATMYVWGAAAFPGADQYLGYLVSGLWLILTLAIVYPMLATIMPRTGGDYVFQSRVLGGFWGFVLSFAAMIIGCGWWFPLCHAPMVWAAWQPFFITLGSVLNRPEIVDFGVWMTSRDGIWWSGVVIYSIATLVCLSPSFYAKLNKWVFILCWTPAIVFMLITMAINWGNVDFFKASFNAWCLKTFNVPNAYELILNTATSVGFDPLPPPTIYSLFGIVAVSAFLLPYFAWGIYHVGELRGGESLRVQMKAFFGNACYWTALNVLILLLFINWVGKAFYNAFSYTWYYVWFYGYPGAEIYNQLKIVPTWSMLFTIPFIESYPWLALWLSIAWLLSCFCLIPLLMYPMSRVMFAMSFDRALPAVLGELRTRFRSPIPALIVSNIVGWSFTWLYCYTPVFMWTYDIATLFLITFSGVALAGALLPYKKKELYKGSPLAKYKIFGVPLITVCGIGFLPYAALVLYYYFTSPELGISFAYCPEAWYFVVAIYVACAALYYIIRYIRRQQGIDLDLVYAEIPVE